MESKKKNNDILLSLTNDEALVLLNWLVFFNEKDDPMMFQDQVEQQVLFDLEAVLEKAIPEIFREDYKDILSKAREKLKNKQ